MATNFPNLKEVVQGVCPPDWIALTLAEYQESCAETAAAVVSSLISDESLESISEFIDARVQSADRLRETYAQVIVDQARVDGINLETVEKSSEEFQAWSKHVFDSRRSEIDVSFIDDLPPDERSVLKNSPYNLSIAITPDDMIMNSQYIIGIVRSSLPNIEDDANAWFEVGDGCYATVADARLWSILSVELDVNDTRVLDAVKVQDRLGQLISVAGETVRSNLSPEGLIDYLARSVGACYAVAGGLRSSVLTSISDRVASYENYLSAAATGAVSRAKGVISDVRGRIGEVRCQAAEFIDYALTSMGLRGNAEGLTNAEDTPFGQFSGASPIPAINLNAAKNVFVAIGYSAAIIGYGVWKSATTALKAIHNKLKSIVYSFTTPQLFERTDALLKTGRGFVDGFEWIINHDSTVRLDYDAPGFLTDSQNDQLNAIMADMLNSEYQSSGCIAMHTLAGEITLNPLSNFSATYIDTSETNALQGRYSVHFKPACVNVENLYQYLTNTPFANLVTYSAANSVYWIQTTAAQNLNWDAALINQFFLTMAAFFSDPAFAYAQPSEDFPPDKNSALLFSGWLAGYGLTATFLDLLVTLMSNEQDGACRSAAQRLHTSMYGTNAGIVPVPDIYTCLNLVKNKDLVTAACGWNQDPNSPVIGQFSSMVNCNCLSQGYKDDVSDVIAGTAIPGYHSYIPGPDDFASCFLALLMDQRADRISSPDDFVYVPYSKAVTMFSYPDYSIKTDDDVIRAATLLLVVIGVVILKVIVSVAVKVIMRKITTGKFFKWTQIQGRLDNAMWNGKVLTKQERRQYRKAMRKLSHIDAAQQVVSDASTSIFTTVKENAASAVASVYPAVGTVLGIDTVDGSLIPVAQGKPESSNLPDLSNEIVRLIRG